MNSGNGGLFDFDEKSAARVLGVTSRTLRTWRKAGQIGFHQLPGGRIRYSMDQLIEFQRACRVAPTSAAA
jgi:excisionase family DNA binding protein